MLIVLAPAQYTLLGWGTDVARMRAQPSNPVAAGQLAAAGLAGGPDDGQAGRACLPVSALARPMRL